MVDGLGRFLFRIDPGLDPLEDEEVVAVDEPRVGHSAFDIGEALGNERRLDLLGRQLRQAEGGEFVDVARELLPTFTTLGANSTAGIAITHSFVVRKAAKL
jgi:hypothetical protein